MRGWGECVARGWVSRPTQRDRPVGRRKIDLNGGFTGVFNMLFDSKGPE